MNYDYFTGNALSQNNQCNLEDINNSIIFSGLCTEDEATLLSSDYWTEISFTSNICIPPNKPLIQSIESINSQINIIKNEVIITPALYANSLDNSLEVTSSINNIQGDTVTGRRLIVYGELNVFTTYVGKIANDSICNFNYKIPFSTPISTPYQINPPNGSDSLDIKSHISTCIKSISIISFSQTCICLCSTIVIKAIPSNENCLQEGIDECNFSCCNARDFYTENEPVIYGICSLKNIKTLLDPNLTLNSNNTNWVELFISKMLTLPCNKLDIKQILSINIFTNLLCQKIISCPVNDPNDPFTIITDKKLAFEAILNLKLTYISTNNCSSIHAAHFHIPFSTLIPVSNPTTLIDRFKISICIEHAYAYPINCRNIFSSILLFVKADNITCRI